MCGIFGIISANGIADTDRRMLRNLAAALVHRGPDGEGFAESDHVAIGMRRLAIIDLKGGWQPLWNEDNSIALVANGEIYNFVELRRELELRGHHFRTGSDCETIIHLYEEYGADCVHHLRGMFAFALHDRRNEKVLIARDRIGEKPLYLAGSGNRLVFASEMRGLIGSGAVPFVMDPGGINQYLHHGFIPEPFTAVRGVRKLFGGHLLEINLDPWTVNERCWWRIEDAPPIDADPATTIRNVLQEMSSLVVRSDVPVGIALSGGVDSSLVAMMAKGQLQDRLTAFSIGYEGGAWQDETKLAKEFADHVGIEMHVRHMKTEEVAEGFADICFQRDDPTADLSGSSYFAVMQMAREHGVPVMLMGHGGDELFWGYKWMKDAAIRAERRENMLQRKAGLWNYLKLTKPPISWTGAITWLEQGGGVLSGWNDWNTDRTSHRFQLPCWDPHSTWHIADAMGPIILECWEEARMTDPTAIWRGEHLFPRTDISITKLVSETYLAVNGIAQGDRLSMATSVESRLPLVDYKLIETVIGLRKAHPDHHLPAKKWLRDATEDIVPKFVFERRKRGFSPPWRRWYEAIFNRHIEDLRNGILVQSGILKRGTYDEIRRTTDRLGRPYPLLIHMLVLECWAQGMSRAAANAPGVHSDSKAHRKV